jgi:hypothetical protein
VHQHEAVFILPERKKGGTSTHFFLKYHLKEGLPMKRNLVALLAALGMLVSLLPLGAFAEEDNTSAWSPPDNKVTDNVEKILVVVSGSDGTSTVTDGDETTEQAVTELLDGLFMSVHSAGNTEWLSARGTYRKKQRGCLKK